MAAETKEPLKVDEYDFDSSDEEDIRNTVGNIPLHWYDKFQHIGYDTEGRQIMRPSSDTKDTIDQYLESRENPNFWRTIRDPMTGQTVILSDKDVEFISHLSGNKPINDGDGDEEPFWGDVFTNDVMETPMTAHPPQKRSFVPSKADRIRVGRMVHAIKMGWMKAPAKRPPWDDAPDFDSDEEADAIEKQEFSDVWSNEASTNENSVAVQRLRHMMRAPPEALPGHEASYNPPSEYLLTKQQEKEIKRARHDPTLRDKAPSILPRKYTCLRHVPFSIQHIRDRYNRARDLFMAPRMVKQRVHTTPEQLLPKIPSLADLRPYPSRNGLIYKGHSGPVICVSISPCGLWLASISMDGTLRIWETSTPYCFRCYPLAASRTEGYTADSYYVTWNPNPDLHLLAVACGTSIYLINPGLTDAVKVAKTEQLVATWKSASTTLETTNGVNEDGMEVDEEVTDQPKKKRVNCADWSTTTAPDSSKTNRLVREMSRIVIKTNKPSQYLQWHNRGDYLISISKHAGERLLLHRVSEFRSQSPLAGSQDIIERAVFAPRQPLLYVASQRHVKVLHLGEHKLAKTLRAGCDSISSMRIHPSGDHLVLGGFDSRLDWFDLDLGQAPFKKLKLARGAVREIDIHRTRPLVSLAMDDGAIIVLHAKISSDLLEKPIITPVQVIRAHQVTSNLGSLSCAFHPMQAHVYSGGADGLVKQFVPWN